jgi:hypothetical protein
VSMQTENMLRQWAEKAKRPYEEVKRLYDSFVAKLPKDLPPAVIEARARFLVYRELKAMMRYPGLMSFDGIVLGINPPMDVFARRRQQALEEYQKDPVKAFQLGFVNAEGKPIFKMPSGQTVDISGPVLLRQSVGIAKPSVGGQLKWFVMLQRREQAEVIPPLKVPVRFSANVAGETEFRRNLTMTRNTKFEPVEVPEFGKVDDAKICELLRKAPKETVVTCATLAEWHNRNSGDPRRICVLEGDVMFIRPEPTALGNVLMVLEDETVMGFESEGVPVWLHKDILSLVNFGSGSRVIVIGRTTVMPGFDPATRTVDRSRHRIGINAFGVYADPLFKVAPEEELVFDEEVEAE